MGSIRVGDAVFSHAGTPAVVQDRDALTGKVRAVQEHAEVAEATRHGYLNGLAPETRQELYSILDQVKGDTPDQRERVERLRVKVEELEADPRNLQLSRYLRAEMVHIMNTHGIKPREFTVNESRVR